MEIRLGSTLHELTKISPLPRHLSTVLFLAITLTACSNELTLEAPYEDIPVAYAYLDAADDRHFVRIEKAFLESGGDALDNARNPDSLYYGPNEATVTLTNLATSETVTLDRVDGGDFGLNRRDGIFATSPNILYTTDADDLNLRPGQQTALTIERPGEPDARAVTTLIQSIDILRPTELIRIDDYGRPLRIIWSKGPNAVIYDVRMTFNYRELFPGDPDRNRDRSEEFVLATAFTGDNQSSNSQVSFEIEPELIYRAIGDRLEPIDGVVRRFETLSFTVTAAGQEVLDLVTVQNANAGITSSQSIPRYTNLENGIGLFTSRSESTREDVLLDDGSLDSLRMGFYTSELNFR